MPGRNPKDVFLLLLSDARTNTERASKFYGELSSMVQDPEVKEAVEARAYISLKTLEKLDQCFKIFGEQPVKLTSRVDEALMEDFKERVSEIQSPAARHLIILSKLIQITHHRIGEFVALTAASDLSGHFGVGILLESCLGEKLGFVERARRLIHRIAEAKAAERVAA
jgi:ferritin-like metal-binding protein YciE